MTVMLNPVDGVGEVARALRPCMVMELSVSTGSLTLKTVKARMMRMIPMRMSTAVQETQQRMQRRRWRRGLVEGFSWSGDGWTAAERASGITCSCSEGMLLLLE